MTYKAYPITFLLLFISICLFSQEPHPPIEKEPQEKGIWEIILSGVSFWEIGEHAHQGSGNVWGTELHITYWFNNTWALGTGYTLKFEGATENEHEWALIGSYKPVKWITLNFGPDLSLPNSAPESKTKVSAYLESEFNFFINHHIHTGPVIGGLISGESEIFTGIHLGVEF